MPTSAGPVLVIGLPPPRSTLQSLLHTICRFAGRQPTYHTPSRVSMPSLDFRPPTLAAQRVAKSRTRYLPGCAARRDMKRADRVKAHRAAKPGDRHATDSEPVQRGAIATGVGPEKGGQLIHE